MALSRDVDMLKALQARGKLRARSATVVSSYTATVEEFSKD